MAAFSGSMPATGVYLVSPLWIAAIAACLTLSGVSKSGSPMVSGIMVRPCALRSRAFCVAATVADGFTRISASDTIDMTGSWGRRTARATLMRGLVPRAAGP